MSLAVSRMCKSRFAEHLFTFLLFYSFTFKQVLFAHKRSLVCNEKKPSLHSKQGLFKSKGVRVKNRRSSVPLDNTAQTANYEKT